LRRTYRPYIGYAKFIADNDTITVHEKYIRIAGLYGERLRKWLDFVDEYHKERQGKSSGVFILDTSDDGIVSFAKGKKINVFPYNGAVGSFDAYVFYMTKASMLKKSPYMRRYLAELTYALAGFDVELGAECINAYNYEEFLRDPSKKLLEVSSEIRQENSIDLSPEIVQDNIWKAKLKIFFPLVEEWRKNFVSRYRKEIEQFLPIDNSVGEKLNDVEDVEIGQLSFLANKMTLPREEYEAITLCKKAKKPHGSFKNT